MSIYANGILSIPAFFYQNMQIFKAYYGNALVYQLNGFDCYLKNGFCINSPVYQRATGINSSYVINNWTEKTVPQQTGNFGAYTAYTNSQRRSQGFYLVGPVKNVYFSNLENFAYGINIKKDTFSKFQLLFPESVNSMNNAFRNCNIDGFNFFNVSLSDSNIQYMANTFINSNLSNMNITIKDKNNLANCFWGTNLQNTNIVLDNINLMGNCFRRVSLKYLNDNSIYLKNIKNLADAFSDTPYLKDGYSLVNVNIPNGAENITNIFSSRGEELQEVTIPGSILFANRAFSLCNNLKRVYVKDLNHYVNCQHMFDGCDSLTNIHMINSNRGFEEYFFRDYGRCIVPSGKILNIYIENKDNYYFGEDNYYMRYCLKSIALESKKIEMFINSIDINNNNNINSIGAFSTAYRFEGNWRGQLRFLYNWNYKEVENNIPIINTVLFNGLDIPSKCYSCNSLKIFNSIPNSLYEKVSNFNNEILYLTDFNINAPEIIFYSNYKNNRAGEFYINSLDASPKLYFEENSNLLFYGQSFSSDFFNVFSFEKVKNAYGMFLKARINDNDIFFLENVNDDFMYAQSTVTKAKSPDYIKHMNYTYAFCNNLITPACGNNVKDMIGTYYRCNNLNLVTIGPNVINIAGAYASSGLNNIIISIPDTVLNMGAIKIETSDWNNNSLECYFGAFTNTKTPWTSCGDNVIDMSFAYAHCGYKTSSSRVQGGIFSVACGDNVINMKGAYYNCNFISAQPICGNNVVDFSYAYALRRKGSTYTVSVGQPVCGPNVQNFSHTYEEYAFRNIENSIIPCGDNVIDMSYTYSNCVFDNAISPSLIIGDNVINAAYCYYNCKNLNNIKIPTLPNKLINISGLFYNINPNIKEEAQKVQCPDNVVDMSFAYVHWTKLEIPICGPNVVSMAGAYRDCTNLKKAICGENVTNISYTYRGCYNLKEAVCGNNVTDMVSTYEHCTYITKAVCGEKVINFSNCYENCYSLKEAVCGNNVTKMDCTYWNCNHLTTAVCGPNVTNMYSTYYNCTNLTTAVCGNNVVNMFGTYWNCNNLATAVCGENVVGMTLTYSYCTNLTTIPNLSNFPKIKDLTRTFVNCKKLDTNNISLPDNIITINGCFCNVNKKINIYVTKNSVTDKTIHNSCLFDVDISNAGGIADEDIPTYNFWSNNLGYDDATNNLYVYYK